MTQNENTRREGNPLPSETSKPKWRKPQPTIIDDNEKEQMLKFIDPITVKRNYLVEELFNNILNAEVYLKTLKETLLEKVKDYLQETAENYGEDWQGNAALLNYKKTKQIRLAVHKKITFDERLNIAKAKIDQCLKTWATNAKDELRHLVMSAFNVDKKGNVDMTQILRLKEYKFDDPTWQEAMKIIDDSLTTVGTKEYLTFYYRDDPKGAWQGITLNFSAIGDDE